MNRLLVSSCVLLAMGTAHAERLPVRVFTTADGLANNRVERGTQDTHGFLWFATGEGVSRFDRRRFESFGTADGLPGAQAHDILATRDGRVWAATEGGLAVLDLYERAVRPRFCPLSSDATFSLLEDPSGVVWAGTSRGLARIEHGVLTDIPLPAGVLSISYDARDRSLWLGTFGGLMHRTEAGAVERFRVGPRDDPDDRVFAVLVARDGKLWVGHVSDRLLVITLPLAPTAEPLSEASYIRHLKPDGAIRRHLMQDSTGTIWIGTTLHLHRWNGTQLEAVLPAQIGSEGAPTPSVEDSAGNLWFGTDAQGVIRLARGGLVSYDTTDGLDSLNAYGFPCDPDGEMYSLSLDNGHVIQRRDGEHFVAVRPIWPVGVTRGGWGYGQVVVIDREHRWWYPTGDGLLRYPAVARIEDLATTTPTRFTNLPGRDILRLYQDRRGDIWISTMSEIGLARWDRATNQIVTLRDGWPKSFPSAYAEDRRGDLWIGFEDVVVRVHDGVPQATLSGSFTGYLDAILFDRAGRMWLASNGQGVVRIDDPDHPSPRHYRSAELGSDQALSLVEDLAGSVYVGTSRGIARIDPSTDEIAHYGAAEGLRNDYILASARDKDGALWFGSKGGMARLTPGPPRPANPRVYITRLSIAGTPQALAPGGEEHLGSIELASDETALDLEIASPQLAIGGVVRFQYRLDAEWSPPVEEQVLHFARLAPGHYDLEVRALDAHDVVSPSATLTFRVLPPIWRRWWFMLSVAAGAALLTYAAYRRQLAHMLALERVRRRIATDLHDELGSSLSRISILCEVASRPATAPAELGGQLQVIGTSARELVDVASDIVWSTDPRRDDLQSLIVRLRSFAADVFEARGIGWSVKAPHGPDRIKLDPERRRHLYLVLKEAITNAARHSGATRVDVSIGLERGSLVAIVRDNGRGFEEATQPDTGNGLANMRARAIEAGGTLEIRADQGTEVVLRL